jgi:hypothetical protein
MRRQGHDVKSNLDPQIDDLYKLALDEFTNARNTLAKTLSGADKKEVSSLVKPSVAMWVVNQLYWQDAPTYKALVDASEKLRAAHRAALNGRHVDTRKPDELHRTTLEKALVKALAIAQKKGTPVTDPVRDAVRRTLAMLPTEEPPGRLTREPPPVGFSLLTGIKPREIERPREKHKQTPPLPPAKPSRSELQQQRLEEKRRKADEAKARKEEEKARNEKEKREREIRKAEQALRDAERRLAELKKA